MDHFAGYTAAQGRKNRKALLKSLEDDETRRHKEKITKLRRDEAKLVAERNHKLGEARQTCAARRQAAREAADEVYRKAVDAARAERRAKKHAATKTCAQERATILAETTPKIAKVRGEREEETSFRNELRRNKNARRQGRPKVTAAERQGEREHEVLANIPENLIPLWERVRNQIKGSARRSRTEEFLQYVEEHPDEVFAAQEREVERFLKAEQARIAKEAGEASPLKKRRNSKPAKAIDNYRELASFFESVALDG